MLKAQVANRSEDRILKLEAEIVTYKGKIKDVEVENKGLQKLQNEQGKFLEMLQSGTDFQNKLKVLNEELRVQREKMRDLQAKYNHEEAMSKTTAERTQELEEKHKQLAAEVQAKPEEEEPKKIAVINGDIEEIKKKTIELEKQRKQEENKTKKQLADYENQYNKLQEELSPMQQRLREKEQESRILDLKIKDLTRTVKSLQTQIRNSRKAADAKAQEEAKTQADQDSRGSSREEGKQ